METEDVENPVEDIKLRKINKEIEWNKVHELLVAYNTRELNRLIGVKGFKHILHPVGADTRQTLLHSAVEMGDPKYAEYLLKHPEAKTHNLDFPDYDGYTPIFNAVRCGSLKALELLCEHNFDVNARNNHGSNVLHEMVKLLTDITNGNTHNVIDNNELNLGDRILLCLDYLLDNTNLDLEAHNSFGVTPFLIAAQEIPNESGSQSYQNLVLFCKKLFAKGANVQKVNKFNKSIKDILVQKKLFDEIQSGITPCQFNRPFVSSFVDSIISDKSSDILLSSLIGKSVEDQKKAVNALIGTKTVLFTVVDRCQVQLVEMLLENKADPCQEQPFGQLPLHIALARGNYELVDLLIENMKLNDSSRDSQEIKIDLSKYTFELFRIFFCNAKNVKSSDYATYLKCLKRIMSNDVKLNLNSIDYASKQSVMHLAAEYHNQDVLKLLIENGASLGSTDPSNENEFTQTLNALNLKTFENAMDKCINRYQTGKNKEEYEPENVIADNYTLSLNYKFLVPTSDPFQNFNEIKILRDIGKNEYHSHALQHPLLQAFIYAKWRKTFPTFCINLFTYALFAFFLSCFLYSLTDVRMTEEIIDRTIEKENKLNSTLQEAIENGLPRDKIENYTLELVNVNSTLEKLYQRLDSISPHVFIFTCILIPFIIYMTLREIFQLIFTFDTYKKNYENIFEWILIIVLILLVSVKLEVNWTKHLAAWEMIIAWCSFLFILGRAPYFVLYVSMLRLVSINFLKLLGLFFALILAFSVSFNILLGSTEAVEPGNIGSFGSLWTTIPRAIVMSTGEFEFVSLHQGFFANGLFTLSTFMIFFLFMFLIFLVLMNVMNGLAVTDAREIREYATLYSLKARMESIFLAEEMLLASPKLSIVLEKLFGISLNLLSGSPNPQLLARINYPKKGKRILYGNGKTCRLSKDISNLLRSQRLEHIQEQEMKKEFGSMAECIDLLQELKKLVMKNSRKY